MGESGSRRGDGFSEPAFGGLTRNPFGNLVDGNGTRSRFCTRTFRRTRTCATQRDFLFALLDLRYLSVFTRRFCLPPVAVEPNSKGHREGGSNRFAPARVVRACKKLVFAFEMTTTLWGTDACTASGPFFPRMVCGGTGSPCMDFGKMPGPA